MFSVFMKKVNNSLRQGAVQKRLFLELLKGFVLIGCQGSGDPASQDGYAAL
jgi:hypothetical protein